MPDTNSNSTIEARKSKGVAKSRKKLDTSPPKSNSRSAAGNQRKSSPEAEQCNDFKLDVRPPNSDLVPSPKENDSASPARETDHPAKSPDLNNPVHVQAINRQAAILENMVFPEQFKEAMDLSDSMSIMSIRLRLARYRHEAEVSDPIEKILADHILLAHHMVAEMFALAAKTDKVEYKHLYHGSAARVSGSMCQLVTTLTAYRSSKRTHKRRATEKSAETTTAHQTGK